MQAARTLKARVQETGDRSDARPFSSLLEGAKRSLPAVVQRAAAQRKPDAKDSVQRRRSVIR